MAKQLLNAKLNIEQAEVVSPRLEVAQDFLPEDFLFDRS